MARHLTPQLYAKLRDRITPSGYTIDDVIQVGVDNPRSPNGQYFGVTAGDEESYRVGNFRSERFFRRLISFSRCSATYSIH